MKLTKKTIELIEKEKYVELSKIIIKDTNIPYTLENIYKTFNFETIEKIIELLDIESKENKKIKNSVNYFMFRIVPEEKAINYIVKNKIPFDNSNFYKINKLLKNENFFNNARDIVQPIDEIYNISEDTYSFFAPIIYDLDYKELILAEDFFNKKFDKYHIDKLMSRTIELGRYKSFKLLLENKISIKNNDYKYISYSIKKFPNGFYDEEDKVFNELLKIIDVNKDKDFCSQLCDKLILNQKTAKARAFIYITINNNINYNLKNFTSVDSFAKFIINFYTEKTFELLEKIIKENNTKKDAIITSMFKYATILGRVDICNELIENGYNVKSFTNSEAYKNISENGSLVKKKVNKTIEITREKILKSIRMNELKEDSILNKKSKIEKTKLKI